MGRAMREYPDPVDMLVIGGGINGAGIARDAVGRGLRVALVEKGDLGGATSSASSKLIHGGLRYLEQFEFRLVSEALGEREVLLNAAPHLVHPMRFVMPHVATLRPTWIIRAGLLLYDTLARRQKLPGSGSLDLTRLPCAAELQPGLKHGYAYSDCRVDDARLVIATARSASALGARILPRTRCSAISREGDLWSARLMPEGGAGHVLRARSVVNATGPWARSFLTEAAGMDVSFGLRLVQGSHIVVPRLYSGDHAFILQNEDRRVVFVYPWETGYTLIGTTDVEYTGAPEHCAATQAEVEYLCRAANRYFRRTLTPGDVVYRYAGIRPLFDDGSSNPSQVTRDYVLRVDGNRPQAPLQSVFGGKITTYRRLAEQVVDALRPWFPGMGKRWTATATLDGGNFSGGLDLLEQRLAKEYAWLPDGLRRALLLRHGCNVFELLMGATALPDLGAHYGADLYDREIRWFIDREWAVTGEDVLWRRTRCGLHLPAAQQQAVAQRVKNLIESIVTH